MDGAERRQSIRQRRVVRLDRASTVCQTGKGSWTGQGVHNRNLSAGSFDLGTLFRHRRDFEQEINRLWFLGDLLWKETRLRADIA